MSLLIINAEETRRLLPMQECIEVMAEAMRAASGESVRIPPRTLFYLQDDSGFFAVMPGASQALGSYGAKLVGYHPLNAGRQLPVIRGVVVLFDHETGEPQAIIDGGAITNIRTAAASGLATRVLARPDARSCGILGAGALAGEHIDAMCAVRPVEEVVIWARRREQAESLVAARGDSGMPRIRVTDDPAEAAACDLVCTVTGSPEPVLRGRWVRPGAHVNLVGAHAIDTRESDTDLIVKSRVYVDLLESVQNEGGDVMIPVREGAVGADHVAGELGQVLAGRRPGRQDPRQITVYNSLGITAQDLFAARYVLKRARQEGVGSRVAF